MAAVHQQRALALPSGAMLTAICKRQTTHQTRASKRTRKMIWKWIMIIKSTFLTISASLVQAGANESGWGVKMERFIRTCDCLISYFIHFPSLWIHHMAYNMANITNEISGLLHYQEWVYRFTWALIRRPSTSSAVIGNEMYCREDIAEQTSVVTRDSWPHASSTGQNVRFLYARTFFPILFSFLAVTSQH